MSLFLVNLYTLISFSKTCQSSEDHCLTCYAHRTIIADNKCSCDDGYYDDGSSNDCKPCFETCKTCDGGNNNECESCESAYNRELVDHICVCSEGYYHDGSV